MVSYTLVAPANSPVTPPRDYRIRPHWSTDWATVTAEVPAPAHG
jgi:hypothetical protein